jgi:putative modified peptide
MASKKPGGKPPLDAKTADRLLDKLTTDNAFRRLFKRDPSGALASLGFRSGARPAACASVQAIAPKGEIEAARAALKNHLMAKGMFDDPHCFEAGKVEARLRRK